MVISLSLPLLLDSTENMIKFSSTSKTTINSMSEKESKILSVSKAGLFMTIIDNIEQSAIFTKISPEFLHHLMASKDNYFHS